MGPTVKDTGEEGSRLPDVGPLLSGHHIGRINIWSSYIGGESLI